mgnify:CR=1 FL=1
MGKNKFLNKLRASGSLRSFPKFKLRRFPGGLGSIVCSTIFSSLHCFDFQNLQLLLINVNF